MFYTAFNDSGHCFTFYIGFNHSGHCFILLLISPDIVSRFTLVQIDSTQYDKILRMIKAGKEQGAKLMCGGGKKDGKGYFIESTVFADVTDDMVIAEEEVCDG